MCPPPPPRGGGEAGGGGGRRRIGARPSCSLHGPVTRRWETREEGEDREQGGRGGTCRLREATSLCRAWSRVRDALGSGSGLRSSKGGKGMGKGKDKATGAEADREERKGAASSDH